MTKDLVLQVVFYVVVGGFGTGICAFVHSLFRLVGGENMDVIVNELKIYLLITWGIGFAFLLLFTLLSYLFG